MVSVLWQYCAAIIVLVSFLTWLLGALRVLRPGRGMAISAAIMALLGLVPIAGLSAAEFVLSCSPSLSVAGVALWAALLFRRLTGHDPLGGYNSTSSPLGKSSLPGGYNPSDGQQDSAGIKALALVVFAVALPLYVSYIGGIGPDIYGSGYGFSVWDFALGASAVMALFRRSRLCYVLLASLAAHSLGLLESSNIFDALVDGPALLASMAVLLRAFFYARLPERDSLPNRPRL